MNNESHSCPDNIGINYSRNTVDGERTDSHFRGNDNVVFCHSCPDNIGINYSRNPQVYKEVDSRLHGNDK